MVRVRGSYALELMFRDYPGEIWVGRKDSLMIIGIADCENLCSFGCFGNSEIHPEAWHVGMAVQYVLEEMADIPVRVELLC